MTLLLLLLTPFNSNNIPPAPISGNNERRSVAPLRCDDSVRGRIIGATLVVPIDDDDVGALSSSCPIIC